MKKWPWLFGIGLILLFSAANPGFSYTVAIFAGVIGAIMTIVGLALGLKARRLKVKADTTAIAEKMQEEQMRRQQAIEQKAREHAEYEAAAARRAEWERTHGRMTTGIAGVTFNNDDGMPRQKILRDLKATGEDVELSLEEYDYNGKPAIRVLVDDVCIGNIPRSRVEEFLAVMDQVENMRLDIDTFRPEEEEDEDGNIRHRGELIYRADLTLIYKK